MVDCLFVSMGVSAMIKVGNGENDKNKKIILSIADDVKYDLGEARGYRGFAIETKEDGIYIYGNDERVIAQAVYYTEELMTLARAPFMAFGKILKKPLYTPQMVHSGYGLDEYPDEYLAHVAHAGRDAILIFVKGVTLVGESVAFPSKDPRTSGRLYGSDVVEGIPTGRTPSGWFPCSDYPQWLNFIKKIIRKYNKDAEIVFWTYNWGFQPKEERIKLIENLPQDIILQATFEMFQERSLDGSKYESADYSLAPAESGDYFKSEAEAAKKRGIRLHSMTNTGGLTWDMGVIPYEPFPYQWIKRYKSMDEAREKWSLSGLMECHHYGMYPSFISKFSKWVFMDLERDYEKILMDVIKSEFGKENAEDVDKALRLWSDAISFYTPTDADQYGAFRVGPSYPFCLDRKMKIPALPYRMLDICTIDYDEQNNGRNALSSIRVEKEIKSIEKMRAYIEDGIKILKAIENPNEELLYLVNLGEFILCTVTTGLNAKKWYRLKNSLKSESDKKVLGEILDKMHALLTKERENAESAIPFVRKDSRLGWEPSMEYMTDERRILWKLRQIDYVINVEIQKYRKSLAKA